MKRAVFENLVQVPTAAFWLWIIYRKFVSPKPLPGGLAIPGRIFRLAIILVTFGLLAGCANPDPLAVASGPLFPLNAGHWQPTPQDMNAPPVVAHN